MKNTRLPSLDKLTLLHRLRARQQSGALITGGFHGGDDCESCDFIVFDNIIALGLEHGANEVGLLPFGNANDLVRMRAPSSLLECSKLPVLAGVCATDPFASASTVLDELARVGFSGVINLPSVGKLEGGVRQTLEDSGMGFDQEVKWMKRAAQSNLMTVAVVFSFEQGMMMASAGADLLFLNGPTIDVKNSAKKLRASFPELLLVASLGTTTA